MEKLTLLFTRQLSALSGMLSMGSNITSTGLRPPPTSPTTPASVRPAQLNIAFRSKSKHYQAQKWLRYGRYPGLPATSLGIITGFPTLS